MYIKLVTNIKAGLLVTGLLLLFSDTSFAQLQYNFERINTENGLPTNAIKGLQFDEKTRFLWVATESGIVRYNGHGFQSFGDNEKTYPLNGRIVFFEKALNGNLFGKLIDETIFTIDENKAVIDKVKSKLVGEHHYLNYKYGIQSTNYKVPFIEIDQQNYYVKKQVIAKIIHKLYTYNSDKKLVLLSKLENDESGFVINDNFFLLRKEGVIYKTNIGDKNIAITKLLDLGKQLKYDPKNAFTQIKVYQNHPNEPVYLIAGSKLFTVNYNNEQIQLQLITDQLPMNEFVKYVQIDKVTNAIYIGTDNRGLIVGRPKYFNRLLPNNAIEGVSTSAYAQLLLGNGNIQINTGQIYGQSTLAAANVFYRPSETGTFISKDSILYLTNSDGLVEYDLKLNHIKNISKDIMAKRNVHIQIGNIVYTFNENGVAIKNNKWEYILKFEKTSYNFIIYSLMQVNDNEILAATTDGLYKYNIKLNQFSLFYKEKSNANFRAIYNLKGYYLLGTYGGGVYMYKNDTIKKIPLDQNGYLSYTHCFIEDSSHRVWASTNKGLFMSPSQSLIDFWNIGPGNIRFQYFGKPDGIDQLEMNGGCNPCAIQLPYGKFSFPSIDGLIQFKPDSIPNLDIHPKVYVDKLILDNQIVDINYVNANFASNVKNVELQLGISGMLSQENIMLEYKLDNEPWVRINVKNPNIKYNNPGYGSHKILIRLRNTINSKWDLVEFPFTIEYPWTLHPLMYLVYLLFIVGFILLYIRFKTIIYQRRQKMLEKEVEAKTVSLNNLNKFLMKRNQAKDHVIAIMNHDILTPLKYLHITAKNIAEISNEPNVKSSIKQIAKTTKDLEYLTSNMLNWVKFDNIENLPQKQSVDLYALVNELVEFVAPFKQNESVIISNKIPKGLIIQNWADSLRVLLYNLVVNSIHSTITGTIEIAYQETSVGYQIIVTDTGIGMHVSMVAYLLSGKSKEELEEIPKYKKGNGVGFQIIRNILQLMNAKIQIESTLNTGTKVIVQFDI